MAVELSVVIPTYQRRDLVVAHVRAFADQTARPDRFEVIAVVDGSTDGTLDALNAIEVPFGFRVLQHPNQGLSRTRNRGADAATGDLILFLDDDMEPDPGLIDAHIAAHRAGADVVLGAMPGHPDNPDNVLARGAATWGAEHEAALRARPPRFDELVGGHLSVRRALYEQVGGFDTGFNLDGAYGGEDLEFGYRLAQAGADIRFSPAARTHQRYVVEPAAYLDQYQQAGASDVAIVRRHPELLDDVFGTKRRESTLHRWVALPVARVPGIGAALSAMLDARAVARVTSGSASRRTSLLIHTARIVRYWRGVRAAGGVPTDQRVRILCYHAVSDLAGDPVLEQYGVPPEQLRRHLATLRSLGCQFVGMEEFLRYLDGAGLPRRAVMVTFDDCYMDLLVDGLDVLVDRRVPATAFVVTQRRENTWDQAIGAGRMRLLDDEGLRTLERAGVDLGSHTRTHPMLSRIDDRAVEDELRGSLADLADRKLGRHITVAYPHGEYDRRTIDVLSELGAEAAFTIDPRVMRRHHRFEIPRIEILRRDAGWRFVAKVLSADAGGRFLRAGRDIAKRWLRR